MDILTAMLLSLFGVVNLLVSYLIYYRVKAYKSEKGSRRWLFWREQLIFCWLILIYALVLLAHTYFDIITLDNNSLGTIFLIGIILCHIFAKLITKVDSIEAKLIKKKSTNELNTNDS